MSRRDWTVAEDPRGVLHRHEDGTEHRHYEAGSSRPPIPERDGSDDHRHGYLGGDNATSGYVVARIEEETR